MALLNLEHTRVGFWGAPQFTRSGMWWFTLLFGFFGFHHLYMRSPQTAILTALINVISLGFWWAYDLVQLSSYDETHLNTYGLDSPFGALGLAQGMWATPEQLKAAAATQGEGQGDATPPSPTYALLYYLLLPVFVAGAIGVAGDTPNAVLRLLYIWPLFFLMFPAYFYDLYRAFVTPKDLFERGHSRFMPFTWMGLSVDGHSPNIQKPGAVKQECPPRSFFETITDMVKNILLLGLPVLKILLPGVAEKIEQAIGVSENVLKKAETGIAVAGKAVEVAAQVPAAVSGLAETVADPTRLLPPQALAATALAGPIGTAVGTMVGGGAAAAATVSQSSADTMVGLALAGTLLLVLVGGFFLTGLRNITDEPPAPGTAGLDDAPPKPRAV